MSIPAFFLSNGFSSALIGLTIGIHRFSGIISTALFGPQVDKFNSRNVIFFTELIAALTTLGLISSWIFRDVFGLVPFWIFIALRSITVGVQGASRNRLIKLLSSDNLGREASFVIWLNKVTQGAHVISSLVAIVLVSSGNLVMAIAIDGISFLIGGYSVLRLPNVDSYNKNNVTKINILTSFLKLIKTHKGIFYQDQLLALSVSGTILLMVKLSGDDSKNIIYFNLLFGSCIWLSSFFAHNLTLRTKTVVYWILLFIGFILLGINPKSNLIYLYYIITYMGYWILYHKYTVEIQTKTPENSIGAIMAARNLAIGVTLSIGELSGGYISQILNLQIELFLRALICLTVILFLLFSKIKLSKDTL